MEFITLVDHHHTNDVWYQLSWQYHVVVYTILCYVYVEKNTHHH